MGHYFDDFAVGDEYRTPKRTITEGDVGMYSILTGDYDEAHTNRERWEENTRQPAPHMLLFCICNGLLFRTGILEGFGGIAFAGIDDIQFLAPVHVGDTVHGKVRIAHKRLSKSKPDRGLVYFEYALVNQHGDVVQHSVLKLMRQVKAFSENPKEVRRYEVF